MPRFVLDLELSGAAFAGTQWQNDQRTVQGELERVAAVLDGEKRYVRPASRLDAGVDAEHITADLELSRDWDPAILCQAFTDQLPPDLAVRRAAKVPDDFNAISTAVSKTYRYVVTVRPVRPVLRCRCQWLRLLSHPELLQPCADLLIGSKDLSAFANLRHDDSDARDPVRTITSATWTSEQQGDELHLTFRVSGDGFLYRQVRGFVGAMLGVATGKHDLAAFAQAVASGRGADRLGNVAPPDGLTLEQVCYDPEPAWINAARPKPAHA
ncbi:MAG: hypothetical protein AAB263_07180 [Planctomycetota bacterium]